MHAKKVLNKTLYHIFVLAFGFVMVYPVLWFLQGQCRDPPRYAFSDPE